MKHSRVELTRDVMPEIQKPKQSICVFCGSSPGSDPRYVPLAANTGRAIGSQGYGLVYGGGGAGLMGATANAAFEAGGYVLGIIPDFLMTPERANCKGEQRIVPNMHERKMQMFEASDAFIILPGGIGTIEEAVEIMCWMRLQLHQKPILFLSPDNYWAPLLDLIKHTIDARLSPDWMLDDIFTAETANDAMAKIKAAWAEPAKELRPVVPISKM